MKSVKAIVYIGIILVMTGGFAAAQSGNPVWEGTASMSRYGEFPATGLYAASNSFPRNTIVEIENLQNGKKTTVIIADRLNNPGLFMLLSREAAGALGITENDTVQVRVALESKTESIAESLVEERPYSADPEVNPAARTERYELPEEEVPEARIAEEEGPGPAEGPPREEPVREGPEVIEDEAPRLATAISTPVPAAPRFPSLDLPPEPPAAEAVSAEEPETAPPVKEMPRLSAMAESPYYEDFRLPDLALPSGPPEPAASAERTPPPRETPEISAVETSPDIPGLSLHTIAVPEEPLEEAPAEPGPENGEINLTYMTNPSPDVGPLELWDLDVPKEPGGKTVSEEEETPYLTDVAPSPLVEELRVAVLEEPVDPDKLSADEGPAVAEIAEEERETPELTELDPEAPERTPDVDLAYLDEPSGPAEEPAEEPVPEEGPPAVAEIAEEELPVEIPEDSMLVMEPAEPRPPEDTAPAAVEVPGTGPDAPEEGPSVDEPRVYPEPPEEKAEQPLIAEKETADGTEEAPVEETVTSGSLQTGAYYVQLGVYSESKNAKLVADKFSSSYPVAVLRETAASKQIYKVLLGPVNFDESGGLLYNFRAKGFKDAFIRKE